MSYLTCLAKILTKLTVLFLLLASHSLYALDSVRFESGQSDNDPRLHYKREVILAALEHTVDSYGPYQFSSDAPRMNAARALRQMEDGQQINVFIALTNDEWESQTIPVRIPVRRGILNYRLLLIHKDDLPLFEGVENADDLKALNVGLRNSWTLAKVLERLDFSVVLSSSYDGLFLMLERQRFHYIPRGINEVYDELESRRDELQNLIIEPEIALYIPSAAYIFVSPEYPRLARRLEEGLERMIRNGTLAELFEKNFGEYIERADLSNRRIIHVGNPLLPPLTPTEREELWWRPSPRPTE